jgi:hypothetical protein
MTTMIATARGVSASAGGDTAEEIIEIGVQMQMMTDVQGIAMYRLAPVQSGLKLLLLLPRRPRGPSPFRRPTGQPLDQMPPSPPQ